MGATPWSMHADCLRNNNVAPPGGPHELLLILRGSYDLLRPGPAERLRLVPGTVLYSQVDLDGSGLALHLSGGLWDSAFRQSLYLMLGLDNADPNVGVQIDQWIDRHVAVVMLPVVWQPGWDRPSCRYWGFLNGITDAATV